MELRQPHPNHAPDPWHRQPRHQPGQVSELIIFSERTRNNRTKATKDLLQAAAVIERLQDRAPADLTETWREAEARGPKWKTQMRRGRAAAVKLRPELRAALPS